MIFKMNIMALFVLLIDSAEKIWYNEDTLMLVRTYHGVFSHNR